MNNEIKRIRSAVMTGVGYMIPFVVLGGIFIAIAIAFSGVQADVGVEITNPFLQALETIGGTSFGYLTPILAGFIAYAMADRAALCPGMVGGAIALETGSGFLGGILAGIIAGYIVMGLKKISFPSAIKPLIPIFIIPLLGGGSVALIMYYVVSPPVGVLLTFLTNWLNGMSTGNAIVLAIILGVMTAFDMGGPVNVVACLFAWSFYASGNYSLGGPIAVAICTPPLGMGLATLLNKKKYSDDDREAGKAAIAMGMIGISEGAIPFAAKDPLRVIPSICVGGAVGAVIAMMLGVTCYAPHGGPIVLPVSGNKIGFIIAIAAGSIVTALMANLLKKDYSPEDEEAFE